MGKSKHLPAWTCNWQNVKKGKKWNWNTLNWYVEWLRTSDRGKSTLRYLSTTGIVEKLQTVQVATPHSFLFQQVSTRQRIFVQVTRSTLRRTSKKVSVISFLHCTFVHSTQTHKISHNPSFNIKSYIPWNLSHDYLHSNNN